MRRIRERCCCHDAGRVPDELRPFAPSARRKQREEMDANHHERPTILEPPRKVPAEEERHDLRDI
jgi:hypothetical protein